jgi:hypothetical protein
MYDDAGNSCKHKKSNLGCGFKGDAGDRDFICECTPAPTTDDEPMLMSDLAATPEPTPEPSPTCPATESNGQCQEVSRSEFRSNVPRNVGVKICTNALKVISWKPTDRRPTFESAGFPSADARYVCRGFASGGWGAHQASRSIRDWSATTPESATRAKTYTPTGGTYGVYWDCTRCTTSVSETAPEPAPEPPQQEEEEIPDNRCGPLFQDKVCNCAGDFPKALYCNEKNGWCGDTPAHRNAQSSTTYDCVKKPAYTMIESTGDQMADACEAQGMSVIVTMPACIAAAEALGLSTSIQIYSIDSAGYRPYGCVWNRGRLHLNLNTDARLRGTAPDNTVKQICES